MDEALARLLKQYRFPGTTQPWIRPAYDGQSIVNLVNSLLAYFGVSHGPVLTFHDDLARTLAGKRKILFLLFDGFGWLNLECAQQRHPFIRELLATATRWPLTTVFPSTTSSALTTYMTGVTPAEHGVIGYLMYFPEYERVFNMLGFVTPDAAHEDLFAYGFDPEKFVGRPTVLQRLDAAGMMVGAYTYQGYAGSGLSRLLYHNFLPHPYLAMGDMLGIALDQLSAPVPQFLFLYWSALDSIAHVHGADSEAYSIELRMLAAVIRDQILPRLDDDSALIVCADHGHIDGNDGEAINLMWLHDVVSFLSFPPAGEGREMQVFIAPGFEERVRKILLDTGEMTVYSREDFLATGLLGDPSRRPNLADHLGDLIALPHGSRRILYDYRPGAHAAMAGRHGGLTVHEMVVPLLVWA